MQKNSHAKGRATKIIEKHAKNTCNMKIMCGLFIMIPTNTKGVVFTKCSCKYYRRRKRATEPKSRDDSRVSPEALGISLPPHFTHTVIQSEGFLRGEERTIAKEGYVTDLGTIFNMVKDSGPSVKEH